MSTAVSPQVTTEERRSRLVRRHRLVPDLDVVGIAELADDMVALHATDPTTVYLSAWARIREMSRDDVEHALYEQRSVVRLLGMRRTMFVVSLDTAPLLDRGCARPLAARERERTVTMLGDAGAVPDPEAWVDRVAEETLEELRRLGEATATELTDRVPGLRTKVSYGEGKKWAGEVGMSTRILFLLATEGRIVRGRPRGSWLSSQYRWSAMDQWVTLAEPGLTDCQIRAELVRRYVARFGPVTETDVTWWTGWTKTRARAALSEVGPVSVTLEGGRTGYVLPDDEHDPDDSSSVAFLPGLDPTVMGWKERDWYLAGHADALFDRNGNAGPTLWVDGRVVGGWAQLSTGEVVWRLLEDVGSDQRVAIEDRAAQLDKWLDGTVIASRFPSPMQRELAAGG